MIRTLFFLALGGSVTLFLLSEAGAERFQVWSIGFIVATIMLGALWVLGWRAVRRAKRHLAIETAELEGRLRAALIVQRR